MFPSFHYDKDPKHIDETALFTELYYLIYKNLFDNK